MRDCLDPPALDCPMHALDVNSLVQQTSDHKESPFSFVLAGSLGLCFATEPTYNVWVGGRLLDSPCVLEKK